MKKNILLSIGLFLFAGMILHAQSTPGLYVGDAFQGEMDLYDSLDWIAANAQDGGEYSIVLGASIAASSSVLDYSGKSVTVSLKSSGETLQVSYATRSPSSSLFTIKEGVTFVLEKGVELVGRPSASRPPVTVDGGNFIMNGGAVKDSNVDHSRDWLGGGVDVVRGTFTMNDGIISGNSCDSGAGVYVGESASFIMNNGTISNNSARDSYDYDGARGGGVYVDGTFTLVDGIINNNTCQSKADSDHRNGGGVHVSKSGTFIMQGGIIKNNSDRGIYVGSYRDFMRHQSGSVTMNGGTVTGNTKGGVLVDGIFTMNKGTISKNTVTDDDGAGVYVRNGSFTMNDGEIIENKTTGFYSPYSFSGRQGGGGGVYVANHTTFTMNGGVISKNIATEHAAGGGGIFVDGTFTMNDGIISGNSTTKSGGGILVAGGTFSKSNAAGVIYGSDAAEDKANKANQYGHAVYTKNGSRDTTARATMALDSKKYGAEGGWE